MYTLEASRDWAAAPVTFKVYIPQTAMSDMLVRLRVTVPEKVRPGIRVGGFISPTLSLMSAV
jgi:hypothetical protein